MNDAFIKRQYNYYKDFTSDSIDGCTYRTQMVFTMRYEEIYEGRLFSIPTTSNSSTSPISTLSFGSLSTGTPYSTSAYGSRTLSSASSDIGSHTVPSSGSSGCASNGSSPVPNEQSLIISTTFPAYSKQSESVINGTLNPSDAAYIDNFMQTDVATRNLDTKYSPSSKLVSCNTSLPTITNNKSFDYGKEKNQNRGQIPASVRKMAKPDSFKTVMCKGWLEMGGCGFGQNCRFAHGEKELRPSKIPTDNPKYKTKLCDKYTKTGVCPYGNRCLFIHPESVTGDGLVTNPYIHPERMVQILKERAFSALNVKKNQEESMIVRNTSRAVTPPWFLKPQKNVKRENSQNDFNLTLSLQPSSLPDFKSSNDDDKLRTLSDITNNTMITFSLASSTDSHFVNSKGSPDSGTELDGEVSWGTQIADPFDLAIESDNIARSLAPEFAKPF